MNRAHLGGLPLYLYALALCVLALIVYLASLFFSQSDSLSASGESTNAHTQSQINVVAKISNTRSTEQGLKHRLVEKPETGTSINSAHLSSVSEDKAALQDTESATERSARQIRENLGLKVRKNAEAAVIVELMTSESCVTKSHEKTSLAIYYRHESPTIRSSSFNELRSLLRQFRRCENSEFHMTQGDVESSDRLAQMRFNELKYFFTQHSVPKSAQHYSKFL